MSRKVFAWQLFLCMWQNVAKQRVHKWQIMWRWRTSAEGESNFVLEYRDCALMQDSRSSVFPTVRSRQTRITINGTFQPEKENWSHRRNFITVISDPWARQIESRLCRLWNTSWLIERFKIHIKHVNPPQYLPESGLRLTSTLQSNTSKFHPGPPPPQQQCIVLVSKPFHAARQWSLPRCVYWFCLLDTRTTQIS